VAGAPAAVVPAAPTPVTAPAAWVSLQDGKVHTAPEKPAGLFVAGTVVEGAFQASGGVQGEGAIAAAGQPGWFGLKGGTFHSDVEGKAPIKPYVKGSKAADGSFSPASRDVTY
jgi:hypothetical protein